MLVSAREVNEISVRILQIICAVLLLGNVFQLVFSPYSHSTSLMNLVQLVPNEETAIKIAEAVLYAEIGDDILMYSCKAEEHRNGQAWRVSFLLPQDTIGIEPSKIVIMKRDGKCYIQKN